MNRNKLFNLFTGLFIVALLILTIGIAWITTCGIIKLICICFGLAFDWVIATGIWLVLSLLSGYFKVTNK